METNNCTSRHHLYLHQQVAVAYRTIHWASVVLDTINSPYPVPKCSSISISQDLKPTAVHCSVVFIHTIFVDVSWFQLTTVNCYWSMLMPH